MPRPDTADLPEIIADGPAAARVRLANPEVGILEGEPFSGPKLNDILFRLTTWVNWIATEALPSGVGAFLGASSPTLSPGVSRTRRIPASAWAVRQESGTGVKRYAGGVVTLGTGTTDNATFHVSIDCVPPGARIKSISVTARSASGDGLIRARLRASRASDGFEETQESEDLVPVPVDTTERTVNTGSGSPIAYSSVAYDTGPVAHSGVISQYVEIEADNNGIAAESLKLYALSITYTMSDLGAAL